MDRLEILLAAVSALAQTLHDAAEALMELCSTLSEALDRERRCELRRHKMDKVSQCAALYQSYQSLDGLYGLSNFACACAAPVGFLYTCFSAYTLPS